MPKKATVFGFKPMFLTQKGRFKKKKQPLEPHQIFFFFKCNFSTINIGSPDNVFGPPPADYKEPPE
jgi:hypothetical protein